MDPRFLDHFNNPRNVGTLEDAHGSATVSNPVCGDQITVTVRLDGARVEGIAFKVLGCSGAIAAASAMSELVHGKTIAEAEGLDVAAVDEALGGLPTLKRHGADLAIDGLRAVLSAAEETS